jgi:hypothetical protein
MRREPVLDREPDARRPCQPRDGDVREIGAMFGREAGANARLVDLAVERGERFLRRYAGPERIGPSALLEAADSGKRDARNRRDDLAQSDGDILGDRPFDLADEAQRHMQLLFVLPACGRDALHYVEQALTDSGRRAEGDEKADHGLRQVNREPPCRCNHSA